MFQSLDVFSRAQSVTNAFGGQALPGPAGELQRSPTPPSSIWGRGPTSKGKGGKGRGIGQKRERK